MSSDSIVVFLNDLPVHVRVGGTLADLLRAEAPELCEALAAGTAWATDGRGVAVDGAAIMAPGAIFRVQRRAGARRDDA